MVRRGTAPGPFFRFSDGRCLTRDLFVSGVKSALQAAGGGLLEVCGSQLPHQGGHDSGAVWSARFPHKDPGEMGKFRLYSVYSYSSPHSLCGGSVFGVVACALLLFITRIVLPAMSHVFFWLVSQGCLVLG